MLLPRERRNRRRHGGAVSSFRSSPDLDRLL